MEPGDLDVVITEVLADERVELVQARNVLPGCYTHAAAPASRLAALVDALDPDRRPDPGGAPGLGRGG